MKEGIDMIVAVKWRSSVYIIEAYAEEKGEGRRYTINYLENLNK